MSKINCDLVNFSICLSKIDKSKLKKDDKGNIYLNGCIGMRKEPDQYLNDLTMFFQKTKEEREAKAETVYIPGNAKTVIFEASGDPHFTDEHVTPEDDLPF